MPKILRYIGPALRFGAAVFEAAKDGKISRAELYGLAAIAAREAGIKVTP